MTAEGMCHNGHPFKPGNDMDRPGAPDPLWCNVCGEERRTSARGMTCPSPDSDACTDMTPCTRCPSAVGLLTAHEVAAGVAGQESAWGDVAEVTG